MLQDSRLDGCDLAMRCTQGNVYAKPLTPLGLAYLPLEVVLVKPLMDFINEMPNGMNIAVCMENGEVGYIVANRLQ